MALTQKSRVTDNCIVIFIQSQLIETYNINCDNFAKSFPLENDEIEIRMIDLQKSPGGRL